MSQIGGTLFLVNMIHYTKSPSRSLSNLYVAKVGDVEVGFIHRPKNTKTDKNFWRAYFGIGESATFLGHSSTKQGAMVNLNWAIVGERAVVVQNKGDWCLTFCKTGVISWSYEKRTNQTGG